MNPQPAVQAFLNEADDLLSRIEAIALELAPGSSADEDIHELFRAFHTLKGSGAMFGFNAVAGFTHHVETALDCAREGRVAVSAELVELILRAKDQIKALLAAELSEERGPRSEGERIVAELASLLGVADEGQEAVRGPHAPPHESGDPRASSVAPGSAREYRVRFRPPVNLMITGTDPIALINELRGLGECRVVADTSRVPALDHLQPDQCHLAWDIALTTDKPREVIRDVFMFVEDESELSIELVDTTARSVSPSSVPRKSAVTPSRADEVSAVARQVRRGPPKDSTVRVPSERLDRLVNLVGELVMNQSRLSQVSAGAGLADLSGPVEELERLVDELRDNVLGIRMMPIGTTFSRFKRLVHDLSSELGKEIDLVTEGEDTELDKTVLDQLGEPLVHVIRNSIGHGIESPSERLAAGKPRRGTIRLAAAHVGSNVVLTLSDDGRGLDRQAILAKAVEKGLVSADTELSDRDVHELIFRPGFSTATQVTAVSGRGVGMDVVRRQFEALRGQVALSTEPGRGLTLTLTLPLTLAIIDGLLVEIGNDQFIVPMSVVTETVELARAARARNNGRNAVSIRGELVPYLRLREVFCVGGDGFDVEKVVVVRQGDDRVGLVVDRVLGNHQTVIQSLGRFYRDVGLVSGATIMGDGRVALILDLAGLVRVAASQGLETSAPPSR